MIKGATGEMIKARNGDKLYYRHKGNDVTTTLLSVDIERGYLIFERMMGLIDKIPFEDCTLLHRPFEVGDEVLHIRDDEPLEILEEHREIMNENKFDWVHWNPAWRDAKEWNE